MIFIPHFVNVVYRVNRFAYVELSLHSRDKPHPDKVNYLVLLNSFSNVLLKISSYMLLRDTSLHLASSSFNFFFSCTVFPASIAELCWPHKEFVSILCSSNFGGS